MYVRDIEKGRKSFYFKFCRILTKILWPRPKFKFVDPNGLIDKPFIMIVNHVGSKVPTRIENYFPVPVYMWGTHEMTEGIKAVRHYLVHIYYHQKKHMPLFWARIIGTIFSPFPNGFYRGMRLIPTYTDSRLMKTFKETEEVMEKGYPLVVYPEDSSNGYKDQIEKVFNGFLLFCQMKYRKGVDIPIYVSYFQNKKKTFIINKPKYFSELFKEYGDLDKIANTLREEMNSLKNGEEK